MDLHDSMRREMELRETIDEMNEEKKETSKKVKFDDDDIKYCTLHENKTSNLNLPRFYVLRHNLMKVMFIFSAIFKI